MPVPDYQKLMLPLLQIIENEDMAVNDYTEELSNRFGLTDEEKELTIPSGGQTLIRNRAQWAATYLVKAGLIQRPKRGIVRITNVGKDVLKSDLPEIDNNFLMNFEGFRNFKNTTSPDNSSLLPANDETEDATPDDLISSAYRRYESNTKQEILDLILQSSPLFFERLIIDLFKSMGYGGRGKSTHMGKSGDGGVDGIIDEDPLGLEKIYLQAKRYAPENKINIDQIRSFSGSLHERGARKGIFVTTSSFVSSAYEYADRNPQSLILIDGDHLTKLMYQYDVGVRTVDTVRLKKPDIDYFEEV